MKIDFPTSIQDAIGTTGTYRAGGIDVQDLLHIHSEPDLITDLTRADGLLGVRQGPDDGVIIGPMTPLDVVIGHLHKRYPAIALTGTAVATPQIRAVATLGGNLAQSTRCWYFRNSLSSCFKTGGNYCPARSGDNLYGVIVDQGPCAFPHPSSVGMALLLYDVELEIDAKRRIPIAALWGDGSDPRRDNLLKTGELISAIHLPEPWPGEQGGYVRSISRFAAEWPSVESACRLVTKDGIISRAAVAVGGVANTPLRLLDAETALLGEPADESTAHRAAETIVELTKPTNQTRYKVALAVATITDAIVAAFES